MASVEGYSIATRLYGNYLVVLEDYRDAIFVDMTKGGVLVLERLILTLGLIFTGYALMKGKGNPKELGISLLILVCMQGLFVESYIFWDWIVNPIVSLNQMLMVLFIKSGVDKTIVDLSSAFNMLDLQWGKIWFIINETQGTGSFVFNATSYMGGFFLTFLLLVGYGFPYFIFLYLVTLSIVLTYVQFFIAPPCFYLGAFQKTRPVFTSWLKNTANYLFIGIFACILMGLNLSIITSAIDQLHQVAAGSLTRNFLADIIILIGTFTLSTLFLIQAPVLAAGLTGGQASSVTTITAGTMMTGSLLRDASKLPFTKNNETGKSPAGQAAGLAAQKVMDVVSSPLRNKKGA